MLLLSFSSVKKSRYFVCSAGRRQWWANKAAVRCRGRNTLLLRRKSGEATGCGSGGRRFRMAEGKRLPGAAASRREADDSKKEYSRRIRATVRREPVGRDNSPGMPRRIACRLPVGGMRTESIRDKPRRVCPLVVPSLRSRFFLSSFFDVDKLHQRPMGGSSNPVLLTQTHHGAVDKIDLGAPSVLQILTHGRPPGG